MKKQILLTLLFSIVVGFTFAQSIPHGMNYQAVARDKEGQILSEKDIFLKISLLSEPGSNTATYYSEIKKVTTNKFGLFNHVIGNGSTLTGTWNEIPWSTVEIWMDVAIKMNLNDEFVSLSSTKLLAVPYAYHAGTASQISGSYVPYPYTSASGSSGGNSVMAVPANVWSLQGNSSSNPASDYLGTGDLKDLVVKTNNIERMRILSAGNINMTSTLQSTSPATGALVTAGGVGIAKNLNVGGDVNFGGQSNFSGILNVTNATQSTSTTTGAVIVTGGVGIGKQLNVGGVTKINNVFNVKANDAGYAAVIQNTNKTTGDGLLIKLGKQAAKNNPAMIAADQVLTIANNSLLTPATLQNLKDLLDNNSGNDPGLQSFITGSLPSAAEAAQFAQVGAATACGLGVEITNQVVDILNTKLIPPTNASVGLPFNISTPINSNLHLPIDIADRINSPLHLPKSLTVHVGELGSFDIWTIPGVPELEIPAVPSIVIPAIPLIPAVPANVCSILGTPYTFGRFELTDVNVSDPLNHNNTFITFADSLDFTLGAVTAQSITDWATSYLTPKFLYDMYSKFAGIDPKKLWGELKSAAVTIKDDYLKIGVQYSSGSGDYAEWLERSNVNEKIGEGDIVAVKGGKITKDLAGAEQVMAVSFRPIVLGNIPKAGKENTGNNVAFMGQIPVKVIGPVASGDYIVGNSETLGYGVAISPENMKTEDFKNAVGRSWENDNSAGAKMVNTVVGVHNGEFVKIIKGLESKLVNADKRMDVIEAKLEKLSNQKPVNYAFEKK